MSSLFKADFDLVQFCPTNPAPISYIRTLKGDNQRPKIRHYIISSTEISPLRFNAQILNHLTFHAKLHSTIK